MAGLKFDNKIWTKFKDRNICIFTVLWTVCNGCYPFSLQTSRITHMYKLVTPRSNTGVKASTCIQLKAA